MTYTESSTWIKFLAHSWPLLTQKLKYNSTKTGQEDETESRKTSKKEYIVSNWFKQKKLHWNFGRLAKEKTHKLKPTLEILHAWVGAWEGVRQCRMAKWTLNFSHDLRPPTHSSRYSQPRVRKTFSASFVPQPAENHTFSELFLPRLHFCYLYVIFYYNYTSVTRKYIKLHGGLKKIIINLIFLC